MFLIYHVTSRVKCLTVSHNFAKFSVHRLCDSSDKEAKIFYIVLQDQRIKGLYGRELLIVHPYPAKINSHRHGYIIILVCHVILQDHVI